jgi:hypothetical protein
MARHLGHGHRHTSQINHLDVPFSDFVILSEASELP